MAKLTDRDKKKIALASVNGMSNCAIARKFHVSETTIRRVLKEQPEMTRKLEQKKEQNTLEMLDFMDSQRGAAQKLLTDIIHALDDPERLSNASMRDLATAFGIIADKFLQTAPKQTDEVLRKAAEVLGSIQTVIR